MSAHFKRMKKAADVAAKYRTQQPHLGPGGYVILWKLKPCGWACDLNRPQSWRPGVLAVSSQGVFGAIYEGTGGNYNAGAAEWSAIWDPAPAEVQTGPEEAAISTQ
jgi:hypothetical protein